MAFTDMTRNKARYRQWEMCGTCGEGLHFSDEQAHEIKPVSAGGRNNVDNCIVLCGKCSEIAHREEHERSVHVSPLVYYPYLYGRGLKKASAGKKRR